MHRSSGRKGHPHDRTVRFRVCESDRPAVALHDRLCKREPKPGAAGRTALERPEHVLPLVLGDPRPVVIDVVTDIDALAPVAVV